MKTVLYVIALATLIVACDKNSEVLNEIDLINDGYYGGSFSYDSIDYWCLIEFNCNKYEEFPSGGAMYQKSMSCLSVGTYLINGNTLSFELDSFKFQDFPEPCVNDMLLPGEYQINFRDNNDSIVFERETENGKIIYNLKRANLDN